MGTIGLFRLIIVFTLITIVAEFTVTYAKVIGTHGATYTIKEPDAYEELMTKVAKTDWNKVTKKYQKDIDKLTKVSFSLGKAKHNKKFTVDPTYVLSFDIIDDKGNILYPKGFSFNPLDYIQFPYRIVFFNAKSNVEIDWIKSQHWFNDWSTMLIATSGDVFKIGEILGKTVYIANEQMIKKFRISKTPSIVTTKDRQIIIEEVGVYK